MSAQATPPLGDELLARAFQAAPNGFVLVDRAGLIVAANPELASMFGVAPAELPGRAIESLLPAALGEAHVRLREGYFAAPEHRAMGAGRVLHARHADGHEFPVEIGLSPVPSPQGMLVLASVVDISERLALESAFRGVFDASPYGLLIVDDQGLIAMANPRIAETLGYAVADLLGQPLALLLPERYRPQHPPLMAGYRADGSSRMMGQGRDLSARHRDGSEVPVEIGLSRVRWRRQPMTLAAVTDISTRRQLDLDLRQANAKLEEFTYVASHDLRSPLRGIADLIDWIDADLGEAKPPEVARNLGRVAQRIARLERLIDDLLTYARAGRAATEVEAIDLQALVAGIVELQPLPPGLQLQLDIAVAPFLAPRVPLETTLRNLVGNAVKHHDRPDGRVRVLARDVGGHCVIDVEDDGPGIPAGSAERVFKLFQTLTASQRGSSGLGLAVAKRLVELHGGRIDLESPLQDGRGARFRVRWPRFAWRNNDGHALNPADHPAGRG